MATITNTSVTVWVASTQLLADDAGRDLITIQNDSDTDMYLAFGEAAVLNSGMLLKANGGSVSMRWDFPPEDLMIRKGIYAISSAASKNVILTYVDLT